MEMEMEISMAVLLLSSTCKADPVPWPITVLTYFGYFTTAAVIGLPVINTFFKVWQMKAVGDLRGEPLVASLLCYICSLLLSLLQNKCEFSDTAWINLIGTIFYSIYICLFFKYAQDAHRTMRWIMASAAYIILVVLAGWTAKSIEAVKCMYMLAGLASACTPLGLVLFVLEQDIGNLPDSLSSTVGMINYSIWFVLASYPTQDYYDIVQNCAGMLCSLVLLVLVFRWKNEAEPAAGLEQDLHEPLLANEHVIVHVEAMDEEPAGAMDEGQAEAEAQAAANQAQAGVEEAGVEDEAEAAANQAQAGVEEAGVEDEAQAAANQAQAGVEEAGVEDEAQAAANQAHAGVEEAGVEDEAQAAANQAQAGVEEAGVEDEAQAAANQAQAGVEDEAEAAANQAQAGVEEAGVEDEAQAAANQAQAGANNQGQADAVHEADAIDEGQAAQEIFA